MPISRMDEILHEACDKVMSKCADEPQPDPDICMDKYRQLHVLIGSPQSCHFKGTLCHCMRTACHHQELCHNSQRSMHTCSVVNGSGRWKQSSLTCTLRPAACKRLVVLHQKHGSVYWCIAVREHNTFIYVSCGTLTFSPFQAVLALPLLPETKRRKGIHEHIPCPIPTGETATTELDAVLLAQLSAFQLSWALIHN